MLFSKSLRPAKAAFREKSLAGNSYTKRRNISKSRMGKIKNEKIKLKASTRKAMIETRKKILNKK